VTSLSPSRIMFLPPLYANVPRHLPPPPPPPPPFPGAPPPPFPGAPPPPHMSGEEPGLCGLNNHQWHMVLIFSIPREWAIYPFRRSLPYSLKRDLVSCVLRSTGCPFNCPRHLVVQWFRDVIALGTGAGSCQVDKDGCVPHFII
jgi:hypothetical protein